MRDDQKKVEVEEAAKTPFFARYLEEQESLEVKTDVKAGVWPPKGGDTMKWPSDDADEFTWP